jgi:cephalosporin hydroxylase
MCGTRSDRRANRVVRTTKSAMDPLKSFDEEKERNIEAMGRDTALSRLGLDLMRDTAKYRYTYNFTWLGIPVIQFPQDLCAMQEIIWEVRPEIIVETGIAHGGSLIFYASMLELLGGNGRVTGIDVDIRPHNRVRIEAHPMAARIDMISGSSTDPNIVAEVTARAAGKRTIVVLDSNHTHEHVLAELEAYSPLVGKGSYLVVFDTTIEDQPEGFFADRPWGKTNNPKTAVWEFMKENDRFEIDKSVEGKLVVTVARDGYLRCVKD